MRSGLTYPQAIGGFTGREEINHLPPIAEAAATVQEDVVREDATSQEVHAVIRAIEISGHSSLRDPRRTVRRPSLADESCPETGLEDTFRPPWPPA
jgi:hypothetical protein